MDTNEINEKIHKNVSGEESITSVKGKSFIVEGIEVTFNGVIMHIQASEYPCRSYASTEDLFAFNMAKRMLINSMKLSYLINPVFLIRPKKLLNRLVTEYIDVAEKVVKPNLWKEEYLQPIAIEIKNFLETLLKELGVDKHYEFAEIFANIINIDDAYRLRMFDIANEMNELTIREFYRAIRIYRTRDEQVVIRKARPFILLAFIIAVVWRKPLKKALSMVKLDKVKPDHIDKYWMCVKQGTYKYFGKTDTERRQMIGHLKAPKPIRI